MTLLLELESPLEAVAVAFLNDEEFKAWLTFGDNSLTVIIVSHLQWYSVNWYHAPVWEVLFAHAEENRNRTHVCTRSKAQSHIHTIIICIRAHLLTFKYAHKWRSTSKASAILKRSKGASSSRI